MSRSQPRYSAEMLREQPTHRVSEHRLDPGAEAGWHRHLDDYVVVPLTQATVEISLPDGTKTSAEMTPGNPYARHAGTDHNLRHISSQTLVFIEIERT